ncbi:MAG: hydroxyisourate hydrolase [Rhodospirillales bacterium]|nr:hydroxyisourate hydrolase [Rhodospirillales bacterium]
MGNLTTHVLDTARGKPAQGVRVKLFSVADCGLTLIAEATTNSDGRCDRPIAADGIFVAGAYQLEFHIGDYFSNAGLTLEVPAFLDVVPVRFSVASADSHYHVPLLVSPYGYSTYRGS